MSVFKLEQSKQTETLHQNGLSVKQAQKNLITTNGNHLTHHEDTIEDLLFTSESVGEGHPGE